MSTALFSINCPSLVVVLVQVLCNRNCVLGLSSKWIRWVTNAGGRDAAAERSCRGRRAARTTRSTSTSSASSSRSFSAWRRLRNSSLSACSLSSTTLEYYRINLLDSELLASILFSYYTNTQNPMITKIRQCIVLYWHVGQYGIVVEIDWQVCQGSSDGRERVGGVLLERARPRRQCDRLRDARAHSQRLPKSSRHLRTKWRRAQKLLTIDGKLTHIEGAWVCSDLITDYFVISDLFWLLNGKILNGNYIYEIEDSDFKCCIVLNFS